MSDRSQVFLTETYIVCLITTHTSVYGKIETSISARIQISVSDQSTE